MTDRDELDEARKALVAAETALAQTEAAASSARSARDGIRRIVERNGYVSRFRDMIQGNPYAPSRP